jgi:uncharacterized RDD family membrane protein YckC
MSIITIGTPFNIDLEFKIAAFSKRSLAWLVDIVIICLYYYAMLRFIYPLLGMGAAIQTAAALFVIIIPVLAYQLLFELLLNGQTIGKRVVGIKVIDMEGREPTWGQYITRWLLCIGNLFVYIVPYIILRSPGLMLLFMILYLPDFLCVVISAKSQRIGDFAAGTVVIDNSYKASINETIYLQIEDNSYKPLFPEVMRLTDRDINGIRNLLSVKRPTKDTEHYIIDVTQKIKTVLGIQSDLYPTDFLRQLLKDYNYFTTTTTKTPNPSR